MTPNDLATFTLGMVALSIALCGCVWAWEGASHRQSRVRYVLGLIVMAMSAELILGGWLIVRPALFGG